MKLIPIDLYLEGQPALLNWLWRVYNQIKDFCDQERLTIEQFLNKYIKPNDKNKISGLMSGQTGGSKNPQKFSEISGNSSSCTQKYKILAVVLLVLGLILWGRYI
jgi:hypothetical protein